MRHMTVYITIIHARIGKFTFIAFPVNRLWRVALLAYPNRRLGCRLYARINGKKKKKKTTGKIITTGQNVSKKKKHIPTYIPIISRTGIYLVKYFDGSGGEDLSIDSFIRVYPPLI